MSGGGRGICPGLWPLPTKWLAQRAHSLAGEGLGESYGVAAGLAAVGMVQQPVGGGGGQGLAHEFVESGWVQVRAEGYGAFFVGGVDEPVAAFGGVRGDG